MKIELVGGPKDTWVYDTDTMQGSRGPWTGPEVSRADYEDTGLTSRLGNTLYKFVGEPNPCPICGQPIEPYEGMRTDSTGKRYWCKKSVDEFDSIDWDAAYEREHGL